MTRKQCLYYTLLEEIEKCSHRELIKYKENFGAVTIDKKKIKNNLIVFE